MWGRGFHQRSVEELVKSELKPGFPDGPPGRPRTWLGAAASMALILAGLMLVFVSDCSNQPGPTPAPTAFSTTGTPRASVAPWMPPGYASGANAGPTAKAP